MRSLLIILIVLLTAAAGLAFYLPRIVEEAEARRQATLALERLTGRTVLIEGETGFAVLPRPRLILTQVRISDAQGSLSPGALVVDQVSASLSLPPLLQGRIELQNLSLAGPRGRVLASDILPFLATSQPLSGGGVTVRQVDIVDGDLLVEDPETGWSGHLRLAEAQIAKLGDQAPTLFSGTVAAGGQRLGVEARLSPRRSDGRRSFGIEIRAPELGASRLRADMTVEAGGGASGRLDLRADSADGLLAGLPALETLLPAAEGGVVATADVSLAGRDFAIRQLAIRLPQAVVEGEANGTLADPTFLQADLRAPSLALSGSDAVWPAVGPLFGADLVGRLALRIGSLRIGERALRNVNLSLLPAQGAWLVEDFSLAAAGGASFQFTGQAVATASGPRITGEAKLAAADFRSTLLSLGYDPGQAIPLDRLRLFSGDCRLQWSGTRLTIEALDANVDSTHLTGGLTLLLHERPALGLGLTADAVNLDAYWGDGAAGGLRALAEAIDANLDIRVGSGVLAGEPLSDLAFKGRLEGAALQVEALSARSGPLTVTATGRVGGLGGNLTVDRAHLSLHSAERYAAPRQLGATAGELLAGLGAFDAEIDASGSAGRIALDGRIESGVGRLRVAGGIRQPLIGDWGFDGLRIEAAGLSADRLAPLFGPAARPMLQRAGGLDGSLRMDGPGRHPRLGGQLTVAGGSLAFDGALESGPVWRGSVEAAHPAPAVWLAGLDPQLTALEPGALQLAAQATLDGDSLELADASLGLGESRATGRLALSLAQSPHRLSGRLRFGDLHLPAARPGPPWSRDTIDSDGLRALALDLDLRADRLDLGGWALGEAAVTLTLDGGRFALAGVQAGDEASGLSGGIAGEALFGGGLALGTVDGFELRLSPDGLAPLLPDGLGPDRLAAPIVARLSLETRGRSIADLFARAQGGITFSGSLDGAATVEGGRITSPAVAYRTPAGSGRLSGLLLDLSTLDQDLAVTPAPADAGPADAGSPPATAASSP